MSGIWDSWGLGSFYFGVPGSYGFVRVQVRGLCIAFCIYKAYTVWEFRVQPISIGLALGFALGMGAWLWSCWIGVCDRRAIEGWGLLATCMQSFKGLWQQLEPCFAAFRRLRTRPQQHAEPACTPSENGKINGIYRLCWRASIYIHVYIYICICVYIYICVCIYIHISIYN